MTRKHLRLAVFGALLTLSTATSFGQAPAASVDATAKPMTLTEPQVRGFLDAVDAIRATGEDLEKSLGSDPSQPAALAQGLRASAAVQAILTKNGFADIGDFQRVGYNAAMAYGIFKEGGKEAMRKKMEQAKIEQAKALEQIKQQLGEEQAKQLAGQMGAVTEMMNGINQVPDENIALIKKYAERMAKLSE